MPTINHYRSKGGKLSDIYAALCKERLLTIDNSSQMALGTFRNLYYKNWEKGDASPKKVSSKVVKEVALKEGRVLTRRCRHLI